MLYQAVDLKKMCRKRIFEMYTVKLQIVSTKLIIVCMYRAPSGNLRKSVVRPYECYLETTISIICEVFTFW
jgi:hypothetical protein